MATINAHFRRHGPRSFPTMHAHCHFNQATELHLSSGHPVRLKVVGVFSAIFVGRAIRQSVS